MIKLFNPNDKLFATNGDKIIQATKCVIHKEDNGEFYLDFECPVNYKDYIVQDNILVVNSPTGEQAFRINNVEETRNKLRTKAYHVFYDSENLLIDDSYVVNMNANNALNHLNDATDTTSPFTMTSDINTVDSYRCVRNSLYEAIQTVVERWGGHLVRDNFDIKLMTSIGEDNGVVIRYGKNLKNITAQYDWNDVVTKLMPVGKDGLLLDEKYIVADVSYSVPYTKTISFDQNEILEDDYKDVLGNVDEVAYGQALKDDLLSKARKYITENQIPKVNYTLSANLEKITDIGDTIQVIDEVLGIELTTNLIAYDYDCILEKYTELQFGNFQQKLNGFATNINNKIREEVDNSNKETKVTLRNELTEATNKIWNALGNSYVIYDGDKILVLDKLPKEEALNVIMINSGGIGFSNTGIDGTFSSAWTIDNVLNMENINVINLTADLIRGGTLKLGGFNNQSGRLMIYNENENLIGELDKNGLKMYGTDGSYVLMNQEVGFAGYDFDGNKVYWADNDRFKMKNADIEKEILFNDAIRFIPMSQYEEDGITMKNYGLGIISASDENNGRIAERRIVINEVLNNASSYSLTDKHINCLLIKTTINANYSFSSNTPTFYINYSYYNGDTLVETEEIEATIISSENLASSNNVYSVSYNLEADVEKPAKNCSYVVNYIYAIVGETTLDDYYTNNVQLNSIEIDKAVQGGSYGTLNVKLQGSFDFSDITPKFYATFDRYIGDTYDSKITEEMQIKADSLIWEGSQQGEFGTYYSESATLQLLVPNPEEHYQYKYYSVYAVIENPTTNVKTATYEFDPIEI